MKDIMRLLEEWGVSDGRGRLLPDATFYLMEVFIMENKFDPKNFTKEQIEKAMACETLEALAAFAKESGITLTADEAKQYFDEMENLEVELSDEQMKAVAGGRKGGGGTIPSDSWASSR